MLGQHRRQCTKIKTTLTARFLLAGQCPSLHATPSYFFVIALYLTPYNTMSYNLSSIGILDTDIQTNSRQFVQVCDT